jgi:hypothetical protein
MSIHKKDRYAVPIETQTRIRPIPVAANRQREMMIDC